jgi:pimeloyl-ACP methyl ester carboxylesterase
MVAGIALLYAAQFPDRVKAVINEAGALLYRGDYYKGLEPVVHYFTRRSARETEKYHCEKTVSMFHGWYDVWTDPKFTNWNVENYLASIIVGFGNSRKRRRVWQLKQLQSLKNNIKSNCSIIHIDNCGHSPHFQQREICEKEMINFINNLQFL